MRGQRTVRLVQLVRRKKGEKPAKSQAETVSWEGVDRDAVRGAARAAAASWPTERQVPPYVIFSDATLRELARVRPSTLERMRLVYGIGEMKLRDFGPAFLQLIAEHCGETGVSDATWLPPPAQRTLEPVPAVLTPRQEELFALFRKGMPVEDVMTQDGPGARHGDGVPGDVRAAGEAGGPVAVGGRRDVQRRCARRRGRWGRSGSSRSSCALGEKVPYDVIRLVLALMPQEQSQ